MSLPGPMGTYFGLLERKARFTDMNRRSETNVTAYRCYGAPTVDDAYGDPGGGGTSGVGGAGPTAMFDVERNRHYLSRELRRQRRVVQETHRGLTWATFDFEQFFPGMDINWQFLRWQEQRPALGGWVTMDTGEGGGPEPLYGPIYCVPTPETFGSMQATFSLSGSAPAGTTCTVGNPPVFNERGQDALGNPVMPPLHIVFPHVASSISVRNLDAGNSLLYCYGTGQPMAALPFGQEISLFTGNNKEIILAGSGGAVAYNLAAVMLSNP